MSYKLHEAIEAVRVAREANDKAVDKIYSAVDDIRYALECGVAPDIEDVLENGLDALEKALELIE